MRKTSRHIWVENNFSISIRMQEGKQPEELSTQIEPRPGRE